MLTDLVDLGGRLAPQRLVGAHVIEFLAPAVDHALLVVTAGGRTSLYVGTYVGVHSLVAAIVLRAPRP